MSRPHDLQDAEIRRPEPRGGAAIQVGAGVAEAADAA